MRVFRNKNAFGLINAIVGHYYFNENVTFLIDSNWAEQMLLDSDIPSSHITKYNFFHFFSFVIGSKVVLPIPRACLDIFLLKILGLVDISTFVHDLHFLSKSKLLSNEFSGKLFYFKKFVYILTIRISNNIFTDSRLVKNQIKKLFGRNSLIIPVKRVFSLKNNRNVLLGDSRRPYDYFIPLSNRLYKGFWALDRLVFENLNATIVVDSKYYTLVSKILLKSNPNVLIFHCDLSSDGALIDVYRNSKYIICLSRYEGFGLSPYEALYFGCIPFVFNCSSYLEVPNLVFNKIRINKKVFIPASNNTVDFDLAQCIASRHIVVL